MVLLEEKKLKNKKDKKKKKKKKTKWDDVDLKKILKKEGAKKEELSKYKQKRSGATHAISIL